MTYRSSHTSVPHLPVMVICLDSYLVLTILFSCLLFVWCCGYSYCLDSHTRIYCFIMYIGATSEGQRSSQFLCPLTRCASPTGYEPAPHCANTEHEYKPSPIVCSHPCLHFFGPPCQRPLAVFPIRPACRIRYVRRVFPLPFWRP
jgi:hypothetical protein